MRQIATGPRIREFMRRLGASAPIDTRIYLTGGATAVLVGWRDTTIDVDLKIIPESDAIFRALPELKESLHLNVELASPDLFIPALPQWESRSPFIAREGRIDWYHYDPYSQALAKIERGHERDRADVQAMIVRGLVERQRLRQLFQAIQPDLLRYPSLDPKSFARKVDEALGADS
jgi:hypothetical protein